MKHPLQFILQLAVPLIVCAATGGPLSCVCIAQCGPAVLDHMGGTVTALSSRGSYEYVGVAGEVRIIDVSNPAAPITVSSIIVSGSPRAIEAAGTNLYVACDGAGLTIIDISVPAAASVTALFAASDANDVAVSNGKAYLARLTGVSIVDITSPASPTLLGTYSPGMVNHIESRGDTFFASVGAQVHSVDTANPAAPVLLDTEFTPGVITAMDLLGTLLAVTTQENFSADGHVILMGTANPAAVATLWVGLSQTPLQRVTLAQSGAVTLLYYINQDVDIVCADATNPVAPVTRSVINSGPHEMQGQGTLLFVSDFVALKTFDVSAPAAPVEVRSDPHVLTSVMGLGTMPGVLVVASTSQLCVYDTTIPATPVLLATEPVPAVGGFAMEGHTAYVSMYSGGSPLTTRVFDLSTPASPVLLGEIPMGGQAVDLAVEDGTLFALVSPRLKIFDVSNFATAHQVSELSGVDGVQCRLANGYLYALNSIGTTVQAIDVRSLTAPQLVATYTPAQGRYIGVQARDHTLMLASSTFGVEIYDASDPTALILKSTIAHPSVEGMVIADTILMVSDFDGTMDFYDTSDAANPVLLSSRHLGGGQKLCADRASNAWTGSDLDGITALRLPGAPRFDLEPVGLAACAGSSAAFSVSLGNPAGATYQWKRGGTILANGVNAAGTTIGGATSAALTLTNVHAADLGAYTCIVTNACGSITSQAAPLSGAAGPTIVLQPQDTVSCPTGSAQFSTGWLGTAPATFRWQAEVPLNSGTYVSLNDVTTTRYSIAGAAARILTVAAQPGQTLPPLVATRYRCVITNQCDSVTSRGAQLLVCAADFNCDGSVDLFDYLDFVVLFAGSNMGADFNDDAVVDLFDYLDFMQAFSGGC